MYQPLPQLCSFNKTCEMVIDMTVGEGPKSLEATIGANVIFAARREMVESNPKLMAGVLRGDDRCCDLVQRREELR